VALVVGYVVRRARQINPGALVPQSAPRNGITPAESGLLLNGHIGPRGVAATLVDADRLQRLERYRFDQLLPYAMVFGVEQKWFARFANSRSTALNGLEATRRIRCSVATD